MTTKEASNGPTDGIGRIPYSHVSMNGKQPADIEAAIFQNVPYAVVDPSVVVFGKPAARDNILVCSSTTRHASWQRRTFLYLWQFVGESDLDRRKRLATVYYRSRTSEVDERV